MKRLEVTATCALVALSVTGCAPKCFIDGVRVAVDKHGTRDASTLRVAGKGHLRFRTSLRCDLDDAIDLNGLDEMKSEAGRLLTAAHALALQATRSELDRIPSEGIVLLMDTYEYGSDETDTPQQREILEERFVRESQAALEGDLAAIRATADLRAARKLLKRIRGKIEAPVGDRGKLGRVLLTAPLFIPATLGAEIVDVKATHRAMTANFAHLFEYRPAQWEGIQTATELESADDEQLARWFAPVFLQQTDPEAPYSSSEDQFGRVYLSGSPEHIQVHVDIDDPTVYWTRQVARIGKRRYPQLVYVSWYPSRPALTPGDSEAGRIDGVVLRITLDSHNRPAVYEFVRSCGCYHMLRVAEFVEASARREYGKPLSGRRFVVQNSTFGRELFMPDLVPDDGSHPSRAAAYISAGHHLLMGIEPGGTSQWGAPGTRPAGREHVASQRIYRLERYDTLTALPLGGGVASMFGSDGLVHDAGRAAGWLLAPTGMRSAGQPRQLGTMKIRMDAYDYDDPRLLERHLRFPSDF